MKPARMRMLWFSAVLLWSAGCDHATKHIARSLLDDRAISLASDLVRFQLTLNPGGFLSLGARLPDSLRSLFFLGAVPVTLAVLCAIVLRGGAPSRRALVGLGLVAGGGLANWLDRFLHAGAVTDFVSIGIGPLRTGIFNVADVAVMAGAALLILASRVRDQDSQRRSNSAAGNGAPSR